MRLSLRLWNEASSRLPRHEQGNVHRYWTRNRIYDAFFKTGVAVVAASCFLIIGRVLYSVTYDFVTTPTTEKERRRQEKAMEDMRKKQEAALQYLQEQGLKPPESVPNKAD